MKQVVLLGTPDTKRTIYLERAAAQAGVSVHVIDWRDWKNRQAEVYNDKLFLKIDPPLWESCSLKELDRLTGEYLGCLEELSYMAQMRHITFLNEPCVIEALLDKKACKGRLLLAGVPVTEFLQRWSVQGRSACQLLERMKEERICQVFIKPVRGSGAAGVSAFRYQPSTGRMVLYTCALQSPEYGLINTKRLRQFSSAEEILPLLDQILDLNCIVEKWYAKAEYQGFSYDLRVVVQDNRVDFALARLSKGPITNLHLNNHPLEVDKLGLPAAVLDSVAELCQKSMECYPGLRSAGIDVLLEKGSLKPRVIEMNAQGDLIYQDIYHENRIYCHQAEMMKSWLYHI